jgi:xanthine dehydrogenase accessory factor
MLDLLEKQVDARKKGKPFALATIVKAEGSTPRAVGAKMIVFDDGTVAGSVGGGVIEKAVIADAVECIGGKAALFKEYENTDKDLGPSCGGRVAVFIEVDETVPRLVVCGAGHVGAAMIKLGAFLQFNVTAVDTRNTPEILENAKGAARFIHAQSFQKGIEELDIGKGALFLVSTFSHATDAEALAAVLKKAPAYAGMMGSGAKIKAVFEKLKSQGFTEAELEYVSTPVGLDIGGSTPNEIALSIMSEMQMTRYSRTGGKLKNAKNWT